jgi:hypothetical protein
VPEKGEERFTACAVMRRGFKSPRIPCHPRVEYNGTLTTLTLSIRLSNKGPLARKNVARDTFLLIAIAKKIMF